MCREVFSSWLCDRAGSGRRVREAGPWAQGRFRETEASGSPSDGRGWDQAPEVTRPQRTGRGADVHLGERAPPLCPWRGRSPAPLKEGLLWH